MPFLVDKTNEFLANNIISSLTIAFIIIAIIMGILFQSFRMIIIAVLPNLLPLLVIAGFMGLVSGFGAAFAYLYITQLGQLKEPDIRTVFYFTGFSTIGSAAMLFFEEINIPDFSQIYILVGLGLSATIAQIALTKAYRVGNTMGNAGLSYLTVIFSTLIGLIYFKEFLDLQSILGIFLIILSGIFSSKK
jgi:drug/metabolite transporter (DMT)-like permease